MEANKRSDRHVSPKREYSHTVTELATCECRKDADRTYRHRDEPEDCDTECRQRTRMCPDGKSKRCDCHVGLKHNNRRNVESMHTIKGTV